MAATAITPEEALLRKTTGVKPKGKEDRQDFLGRLLESVEKLDDEDWEKMGQEEGGTAAQQWCNDAVDARKADNELPDFAAPDEAEEDDGDDAEEAADDKDNGDEEGDDAEAEDEGAEDEPEDEPVKTKAKKAAKKAAKPAAKAAKSAKAEKEAKAADKAEKPEKAAKARASSANGTLDGIKVRIKNMVIDHPHIGLEDLMTKLQKGGDKMSRMTVSSVRSETRHTLRVLQQRNKLKGVEI